MNANFPLFSVQCFPHETDVAMDQDILKRKPQGVKLHLTGSKVIGGFPQGKQISPMLLEESFSFLD